MIDYPERYMNWLIFFLLEFPAVEENIDSHSYFASSN